MEETGTELEENTESSESRSPIRITAPADRIFYFSGQPRGLLLGADAAQLEKGCFYPSAVLELINDGWWSVFMYTLIRGSLESSAILDENFVVEGSSRDSIELQITLNSVPDYAYPYKMIQGCLNTPIRCTDAC